MLLVFITAALLGMELQAIGATHLSVNTMGGGLAMDYALAHPNRVRALILVGSGPAGLELDVPTPEKFAAAEQAYETGDLDRVAEMIVHMAALPPEANVPFVTVVASATSVPQTM